MSSREKGMEESSSSRKEWLAAVLLSTISCFMRPSTCARAPPVICADGCALPGVPGNAQGIPGIPPEWAGDAVDL